MVIPIGQGPSAAVAEGLGIAASQLYLRLSALQEPTRLARPTTTLTGRETLRTPAGEVRLGGAYELTVAGGPGSPVHQGRIAHASGGAEARLSGDFYSGIRPGVVKNYMENVQRPAGVSPFGAVGLPPYVEPSNTKDVLGIDVVPDLISGGIQRRVVQQMKIQ